jgi:hypothetical protein
MTAMKRDTCRGCGLKGFVVIRERLLLDNDQKRSQMGCMT